MIRDLFCCSPDTIRTPDCVRNIRGAYSEAYLYLLYNKTLRIARPISNKNAPVGSHRDRRLPVRIRWGTLYLSGGEGGSAILAEVGKSERSRRLIFSLLAQADKNQHDDRDDVRKHSGKIRRDLDVQKCRQVLICPVAKSEQVCAPDCLNALPDGEVTSATASQPKP